MLKIGLSVSYAHIPEDPRDGERVRKYVAMVEDGGAHLEPLYLDTWEGKATEVAHEFQGLILAGGADLPPAWYGQEALPGSHLDLVSERRPRLEMELVPAFLRAGKPIFGICYGCQFLNVYFQGTLVQDIGLQWTEPIEHRDGVVHTVRLDPASRMGKIVGLTEFDVPSYHHQAVGEPSHHGTVVATAPDGIVEAMEWGGYPFVMGVQWHPERDKDSPATRHLIQAFLRACLE